MAAMLLLSLAYVAILESFSASLFHVSKLDCHYGRLLEAENTILATPLFFTNNDEDEIEGETYLDGTRHKLSLIKSEVSMVETLVLSSNK